MERFLRNGKDMYYIIVNPASKSGKGIKIWSQIQPVLDGSEIKYRVFFSREAGHVIRLVQELSASLLKSAQSSVLKLIILGGDGTLNEALQGISDFDRVQVGYIPTGSSNDMARDLKFPSDPALILKRILDCKEPVRMDIGCLTYHNSSCCLWQNNGKLPKQRYFAVSSGIGFDAAVCEEALTSKFKRVLNKIGLGKLTYLAIALKQLIMAKKISCDLTLSDGRRLHMPKFLFVAGMIHQYEGGGFKFCPDANFHDGLIDVCVIGNIPKWLIFLALPTAFIGEHYRFRGIDRYLASRIHIEVSSPLWIHTDGEVSAKSSSITLTCEKEKLHFLM